MEVEASRSSLRSGEACRKTEDSHAPLVHFHGFSSISVVLGVGRCDRPLGNVWDASFNGAFMSWFGLTAVR